MDLLIEKWRGVALDGNFFKLEEDDLPESKCNTYAEFIKSEDFGKASSDFHLGLIPQPYIGNLASAKVFILMLNPGFSPGDYYAQEHSATFKQARIANLEQKNEADDHPFFYLNPEFAWTAGGQWWQSKLRSITNELVKKNQLSFREALRHISQHLACLELCPYFSKEYSKPKLPLVSIEAARNYVQSTVAEKCQADDAIAVVTRQVKEWGLSKTKNVICLEASQARGAHLTMNTEAGNRIYQKLAESL